MGEPREWKVTIHDPVLGNVVTKVKQPTGDWGTEVDIDSLVVFRHKSKNEKYHTAGSVAFLMLYSRDANSEYDWDTWEWELPCNVCFVSNHRNYDDRGCEGYGSADWKYSDFDLEQPDYDDIRTRVVEIISHRFRYDYGQWNIVYEYFNGPAYDNVYECGDEDIKNSSILISSCELDEYFKANENEEDLDEESIRKFVNEKLTDELLDKVTAPTYGPTVELPDWAWSYVSLYDHSGQYWYRCGTACTEGWDTCSHAGVMYVHPKFIEEMKANGKSEEEIKEAAISSIDRMCHVFGGDFASKIVSISVSPIGYYSDDVCEGDMDEGELIFDDIEKALEADVKWTEEHGYERVPFSITSMDDDD